MSTNRQSLMLILALCAVACGKKEESPAAPLASALEVSKAAPGAKVTTFAIQKDSKAWVDMKGVAEEIKADATGGAGALEIDPMNLAASRGEVKIDLTTLAMHTFDDPSKNDSQTDHAQNWLEVGKAATADEKSANRWVVFAIRSITDLAAADVTKVAAETQGGEDMRRVTFTAHGELLLHGHKVNKDVALDARFYWPAGGKAEAPPARVVVSTRSPMVVTLAEHAVEPRDPGGKLLQWTTKLVSKVAKTADVTFELTAKPTG